MPRTAEAAETGLRPGGAEYKRSRRRPQLKGAKGDMGKWTYMTRFWVHSRSLLVSLAALMPSAKLVRAPLIRRCMMAWSSRSSRCLALSWPDLEGACQCAELDLTARNRRLLDFKTYICACFATPLSRRLGSKTLFMRSCRVSMMSTPA